MTPYPSPPALLMLAGDPQYTEVIRDAAFTALRWQIGQLQQFEMSLPDIFEKDLERCRKLYKLWDAARMYPLPVKP